VGDRPVQGSSEGDRDGIDRPAVIDDEIARAVHRSGIERGEIHPS